MSVSLDQDIQTLLDRKVASGRYESVSAALREAVRLLDERDQRDALLASLAVAEAQLDRGEGLVWNDDLKRQIRAEAEQYLREGREPNPDVCP